MNFESSRLIELEKQDSFKKSLFIRQKHLVETSAPIQPDFNFVKDEFSAKKTFTGGQKMFFFCAIASSLALLFVYPFGFTLFFSAFFSIFYFLVCVFRLWALKDFEKYRPNVNLSKLEMPKPNSRYSVLVAIYDEANQVSDLVASLSKLKWPIDALEIFIICEERDEATINAVRAIELPRQIKLVICPPGQPQTKPRALNYAMQAATGDFLVIYDAEDRPHPNQLIEAYNCFKNSEEKLACVQAPLVVDNTDQSFLSKMFAIEYRTLFLGTVRSLAHWKSPMPLGGTSNHFKMNILREIGGWDVYNVTEDADIGIRLARFGYHCGAITCPTWEEAPTRFSDWLPQRTRWLKGWMQTMLVCTRDIPQLHRQLGVGNHFLLHMVMTSIVVSVLVHPFFLGMTLWHLYHFSVQHSYSFVEIGIMAFSMFNLTLGYLTYGLLAYAVLAKTPAKYLVKWIWFLPVYWVLISVAGWRAFFQVLYNPHHWEKTEHGKAKRNTPEITT